MSSILVIDPDETFLRDLSTERVTPRMDLLIARTGEEAKQKIADSTQTISGIFISASFASREFYVVIESWVIHRYGTPFYVLHETQECSIPPEEMAKIGIQAALRKPVTREQLAELIFEHERITQKMEHKETLDEGSPAAEVCVDSDFHPTKAGIFMAGHRSDFDIYIKLGSGNYVKVIHEGDSLDRERLDKYISRGVVDFYVKKDAQIRYLDHCNRVLAKILPHPRVPFSIKAAQVFNYGEQAIVLVKSYGLNDEAMVYCKDSIDRIQNLIKSVDKVDAPAIRTFFSDAVMFEHGVATAVFAALIARTAPFYIDRKADIVLLAALLHDIGLNQLPVELKDEDEDKMTPEQKTQYRTHPVLGADVLSTVRSIPEIVVQAVRQHHERRNGKGFPGQNLKGQPNMIAEVVGLGDEFLRFLKANRMQGKEKTGHGTVVALHEILKGFSPTVVEAFQLIFAK